MSNTIQPGRKIKREGEKMKKKWEVRYFGIQPYEEIATKEMPKQAECAAIITSDSCGFTFWEEDVSQIHIFVTYNKSGLIDSYRVEYGDTPIYDGGS